VLKGPNTHHTHTTEKRGEKECQKKQEYKPSASLIRYPEKTFLKRTTTKEEESFRTFLHVFIQYMANCSLILNNREKRERRERDRERDREREREREEREREEREGREERTEETEEEKVRCVTTCSSTPLLQSIFLD